MTEFRCPVCGQAADQWHYYPGVDQQRSDDGTTAHVVRAPERDQLVLEPCQHLLLGESCHEAKSAIGASAIRERELSRGFDLRAFLRMRIDEDAHRSLAQGAVDGGHPGPVRARKALLDLHHPTGDPHHLVCSECGDFTHRWPCTTIRWLAVMYEDHPAFRPEWAPVVIEPG